LKPHWDETFKFPFVPNKHGDVPFIKFRCWDYDRIGSHDFMGKINIKLDDVRNAQNATLDGWFDLEASKKYTKEEVSGQIRIEIQFLDTPKVEQDTDLDASNQVDEEQEKQRRKEKRRRKKERAQQELEESKSEVVSDTPTDTGNDEDEAEKTKKAVLEDEEDPTESLIANLKKTEIKKSIQTQQHPSPVWAKERQCLTLLYQNRALLKELLDEKLRLARLASGNLTPFEIKKILEKQGDDIDDDFDLVNRLQKLREELLKQVRKNAELTSDQKKN